MPSYHQLLPILFKRFSILTARRTLLPTLAYYARRPALPPSQKPALFTMNILPPMMTVWHHCARKYLADSVDIVIFDCSGGLRAGEFPGATVQKFLNRYAATKSDEFVKHIARNRRIAWICDDDIFFVGAGATERVLKELEEPKTASFSFRPRPWWRLEIDGATYKPSGSYCIAFHREIFVERERLSLAPARGNPHPANYSRAPGNYDTGDLANELLLRKGYLCAILPDEEESRYIAAFSGLSGAVMLLWHFRSADETLHYFRGPPKEAWEGNMLYGLLASMLTIQIVQECYTRLCGKPYPLPSLPSNIELDRLRKEHEPFFGGGRNYRWVEEAGERLKKAL